MNRQIAGCLFEKSTAFVNVKTYVFASPSTLKSCCSSVDIRTARSKTIFLGRQQVYAVPAQSTAQVEDLELPPCKLLLLVLTFFAVSQLEGVDWRVDYIISSSQLKVTAFYLFFFFPLL